MRRKLYPMERSLDTLLVLCAGTDYDADSGDLIADVNRHFRGTGIPHLFLPGPGSRERTREISQNAPKFMLGSPGVGLFRLTSQPRAAAISTLDRVLAPSVGPAVRSAANDIASRRPRRLVIAGWSRGAISAILIAKQFPSIDATLLLFDPVPGAANAGLRRETANLPPSVRRCDAVLMLDEQGLMGHIFAPQDTPFTTGRQGVNLYLLPGAHGAAIRHLDIDPRFQDSAHIGRHLAHRLLTDEGLPAPDWRMTDVDLVAAYGRLAHRALYGQTGVARRPGLNVQNDRRAALFFVNRHHAEVFRRPFPAIAAVIDPRPIFEPAGEPLKAEARRLRVAAPAMAQVVGEAIMLLSLVRPSSERQREAFQELLGALNFRGPALPTDACFLPRTGF